VQAHLHRHDKSRRLAKPKGVDSLDYHSPPHEWRGHQDFNLPGDHMTPDERLEHWLAEENDARHMLR
jgi:hypothetical protein